MGSDPRDPSPFSLHPLTLHPSSQAVKLGSYPVNGMADTVVTFEWMEGSEEGCVADVSAAARALEGHVSRLQPPPTVTIDDLDSI